MEATLGLVLIVFIMFWVRTRVRESFVRPAVRPGHNTSSPSRDVRRLSASPTAPDRREDEGSFFDGYIWGRMEGRHDQADHGNADACSDQDD